MFKKERRKEPAISPKEQVELSQKNIPLRIVLVVLALTVAAVCFANVLQEPGRVQSGWQEIAAVNPQTAASQDFVLMYNLGAGEQSPKAELQAVAALYTETLDSAAKSLANEAYEGVNNLYTLNAQPNTDVQVDAVLYDALEQLQSLDSRLVYYAPVMEQYYGLFACTYDEEAEQFDPARNAEVSDFVSKIASFARDESAVQLKLLPNHTVRLEVSQAYQDYAKENGMESYVDLGLLKNAVLCDAVADAFKAQGYENGVISCLDGISRKLCSEEFALNVFDRVDGKVKNLGRAAYTAKAAVVSLRAFPVNKETDTEFYTYSDGTVVTGYLTPEGRSHAAASALAALSADENALELTTRVLSAFSGEDASFAALSDLSWVSSRNGQITSNGTDFTVK